MGGGGGVFFYKFFILIGFSASPEKKIKRLHPVGRISVIISSKFIIRMYFSKEISKSKFYHVHVFIN